jgi:hypothetical protein
MCKVVMHRQRRTHRRKPGSDGESNAPPAADTRDDCCPSDKWQ